MLVNDSVELYLNFPATLQRDMRRVIDIALIACNSRCSRTPSSNVILQLTFAELARPLLRLFFILFYCDTTTALEPRHTCIAACHDEEGVRAKRGGFHAGTVSQGE